MWTVSETNYTLVPYTQDDWNWKPYSFGQFPSCTFLAPHIRVVPVTPTVNSMVHRVAAAVATAPLKVLL